MSRLIINIICKIPIWCPYWRKLCSVVFWFFSRAFLNLVSFTKLFGLIPSSFHHTPGPLKEKLRLFLPSSVFFLLCLRRKLLNFDSVNVKSGDYLLLRPLLPYVLPVKDGAYFCLYAYVLRISRYPGFRLWVVPTNTRGL